MEGFHCVVQEARHGAEALDQAQRAPPDMIISDVLMPMMDGYTLLRHLKADERLRRIPFIVYTATCIHESDKQHALSLGAAAFVLKPAEPQALIDIVRRFVTDLAPSQPMQSPMPTDMEAGLLRLLSDGLIYDGPAKLRPLEQMETAHNGSLAEQQLAEHQFRAQATRLRSSEERWRTIFELAPQCLKLLAADGSLLEMNSAGLAMIEADSFEQVANRSVNPLVVPEHLPAFEDLTRRVFCGESATLEFQLVGLKGTRVWLETHAAPLHQDNGQVSALVAITLNITDRKRAEQSLQERHERHQAVLDGLFAFVGLFSLDGYILEINLAPLEPFGLSRKDVVGTHFSETVWFKDSPIAQEQLRHALSQVAVGKTVRYDGEVRDPKNLAKTVDFIFGPLRDASGAVVQVIGSGVDITTRKQNETALRENEERLQLTTTSSNIGLWDWNLFTNEVHFSTIWKRQIGYEDHEISNSFDEWQSRIHPDDVERALAHTDAYLADPQPRYENEFRLRHKDGSYRWILARGSLIFDLQGKPARMVGAHIDVTERRKMEDALRDGRQRLESLSQQLIAAQENERRHLALELHDEIGQSLTGIGLNLKALQLPRESTNVSLVHETLAIVDRTLHQVRNLALDLRPSMLDDLGLVAALRWCLDRQATAARFEPHFVTDGLFQGASKDMETACFRVAQESLTNIARHAKARHVRVELRASESEWVLHVIDDGIGFDISGSPVRGTQIVQLGLIGMQERVELVGGQFEITSSLTSGTVVCARFPIVPQKSGQTKPDHDQIQNPKDSEKSKGASMRSSHGMADSGNASS